MTLLTRVTRCDENSNYFGNITFSFFYYEAEDITLKTILKSRVSLRKKSWLMADRVRSFFIKLTSESKYLGPFEIWSSWTNDSHTQFYYPLFIPCSAMLTCLRPRAVSKTPGTVFPNTDLPASEYHTYLNMGTQNYFFVPRSWQDEKTSSSIS